jgi:hypothetical protein
MAARRRVVCIQAGLPVSCCLSFVIEERNRKWHEWLQKTRRYFHCLLAFHSTCVRAEPAEVSALSLSKCPRLTIREELAHTQVQGEVEGAMKEAP